ncbi:Hint domain-containing protein [Acidisphaera rubrifaciens]|uniref:Hedgehog/Intein (Hint) domain-containing protein n=1 Tax=Acidisphaera rubrifaciens HS-AP3 TaxID=1231350 RepID=A0A0D6P5I6_9PROT|nr:Hint domain-containing protein [Acidisphaera rubrifaciens]GAN76124.1 hypothetical protein Asru_0056_07 [Acidisphaera rubrifaciens HS-AP3]
MSGVLGSLLGVTIGSNSTIDQSGSVTLNLGVLGTTTVTRDSGTPPSDPVIVNATLASVDALDTVNVTNNAELIIDGLAGVTALMTYNISNGGTLSLSPAIDASILTTINFETGGGTLIVPSNLSLDIGSSITGFGAGDAIDYTGAATGLGTVTYSNSTGVTSVPIVDGAGNTVKTLFLTGNFANMLTAIPNGAGGVVIELSCLLEGTLVATPTGERPVEALAEGDLVLTPQGARRITWVGRRQVELDRHPNPEAVRPVRVRAGAFGIGRPNRDVLISPDHAVFVDGMLVPIRYLQNGRSIAPDHDIPAPTYYHVELAQHAVIYASGLPVETYLETGGRGAFTNAEGPVQLHADFTFRQWEAEGFAPVVISGPAVERVRSHLAAIADALPVIAPGNEAQARAA